MMQDARSETQANERRNCQFNDSTTQRHNDTTNQRVMRCTTLTADEPAGFLVLCSFASPFATTGSIESRSLARSLVRSFAQSVGSTLRRLPRSRRKPVPFARACLSSDVVGRPLCWCVSALAVASSFYVDLCFHLVLLPLRRHWTRAVCLVAVVCGREGCVKAVVCVARWLWWCGVCWKERWSQER